MQRKLLEDLHGCKVLFNRACNGKGSFCIAFDQATDAIEWCMAVQKQLVDEDWLEDLLQRASKEYSKQEDKLLFNSPRVRIGIYSRVTATTKDPISKRLTYTGLIVNLARDITSLAQGGQILMSKDTFKKVS